MSRVAVKLPKTSAVVLPKRIRLKELAGADPYESARMAGLRYVTGGPGIRRRRAGSGFVYLGPDGKVITNKSELERIRALVIPPAWKDVWICPNPKGHLQAYGRDVKGRKQYRYHSLYRAIRDQNKFGRMIAFGNALPKIRKQVEADLKLPGLPKRKVLAAVVKLLETTSIRVGNEEYAKANESFGLTTMRDHHVKIFGHTMKFRFKGKSGQQHEIELDNKRLARIVKDCQDIPGYELFQYMDDDGKPCDIDSADVNEYLREITGEDFTAKDFRTWNGTGLAAQALVACGPASSATELKKKVVEAVKSVAGTLGNRPATCRAYYIHPAVLSAYEEGSLIEAMGVTPCDRPDGLSAKDISDPELCVMAIITTYQKKQLKAA